MKTRLKKFMASQAFFILIIFGVSFALMLPVLFKGIPFGYDLPHHYQCAMTFEESIRNGDFYPSWSLNRNYGFGGMESRLYPPISHYSLALGYLLLGDWHLASWAVFLLFTFLGGLGVYLWAKEYLPSSQAVFAGSLYILLPYHLNQLYNTFFFAEYVGSCLLPFTFYFISGVCRRGKPSDVLGLIISYGVLILTHLPLTVIGSICFAIYGLTLLKRENIVSQLTKLGFGVIGGLAVSSFFWTKVLLERDLMAKTSIYEDPWLDYRLHFLLTPIQTFEGELRERIYETATFYYDLMLFYAVLLVLTCAVSFLIWEKRSKFTMRGIWLLFGISVFLILPFSKFIWDIFPPLQEVQFPWRWVAVVSIFTSILAASQLNFLVEWFKNKKRPFALIICGSILAVAAFSLSQIVRQAPFIEKHRIADTMETNRKDIGFTFWWTIWTRKEGFENKEKVSVENRNVQIQNWTATNREFQISEGNNTEARIATFYHPNWVATVNEAPTEIKPDANGAILIPLKQEKSNVRLNFVEPLSVQIGGWVSAGVWISILLFGLWGLRDKLNLKQQQTPNEPTTNPNDFALILEKIYLLPTKVNPIFLLVGLSLLTLLPMILFGVFDGGDLYQHVQFATTYQSAISEGNFYPSWGGNENTGYGSNGVRFYPPAISFFLGLARVLTGDWHTANWIVFLVYTIIGSFGVYFWAKEYLPSSKAIWAGIAFILMPYHLIEIHNASMYAEFAGVSILPFSFLFLTRVCRNGKWSDVLGLAVSYGVLILTHLPSSVIGSFSLLFYGLLLLPKDKIISTLFKLGLGVVLGLCSSAAYLSRMLFERDWMRNTKLWHDDHFDYNINFLLTSPWVDNRQLWFFNMVLLSLAIFVAGCVYSIYRKGREQDRFKLFGLAALFFGSILMTTIISKPLWAVLPYLHEVQFPWRWLTIGSVSGSVLIAIGIEPMIRLAKSEDYWQKSVKSFVISLSLLLAVIYGLIWIGFQLNYIPAGKYESWVVEKSDGMGAEWFWTPQTKEKAFEIKEKVIANGRTTEIKEWKSEERIFTVTKGEKTDVRVAAIYYPFWKATVNNTPVEIKASEDGVILIPVGSDASEIRLWFENPSRVQNATLLSKIIWIIFILFGLFIGINYFFKNREINRQTPLNSL